MLPVFDGDHRVRVSFTINPGSAFNVGLPRFLDDLQVRSLPWREAVRSRFDLVLAASANGRLHRLAGPVAIMPHGAGHNRVVESATGSTAAASSLVFLATAPPGKGRPQRPAAVPWRAIGSAAQASP
jgi:hypothetical protein